MSMDRAYALMAGLLWLLVGFVLSALFAGVVRAGEIDWTTNLHAPGELHCTVLRGPMAEFATVLAPRSVFRRTRAVVLCDGATGGLVFALDKRGRLLCSHVGRRRDVTEALTWDGLPFTACGWGG